MIFSKIVMTIQYSENLPAQIVKLERRFRRNASYSESWRGQRDCWPNHCCKKPVQRREQTSRATSAVDVIFSRTKQTISSRRASQARVHTFTPRRCFTQGCREQSCRLSMPV